MRISAVHPDHAYEVEGVNSKVQLAALERTWQRVQADRLLEAGVTLIDPDRIDIRGELVCGQDVEIDVGCVFEGRVVLGNGVRVGAYSVIRNTTVTLKAPRSAGTLASARTRGFVRAPNSRATTTSATSSR